jgi:hypothetical protein
MRAARPGGPNPSIPETAARLSRSALPATGALRTGVTPGRAGSVTSAGVASASRTGPGSPRVNHLSPGSLRSPTKPGLPDRSACPLG